MSKKFIKRKIIFILFLLFPMIKFDVQATNYYVGYFLSECIDNVFVIWDFISIGIIVGLYLLEIKKKGLKFIESYVVISLILLIIFTYSTKMISSMSMYRIFRELSNMIAFLMLANLFHKEKSLYFIQAFYYNITFLMILNSLSIYLLEPWYINETGSVYYLFGLDNATFLITLCGFCSGFIYHLTKYDRLHFSYLFIYLFISGAYFYTASATGMAISILCVFFLVTHRFKIYKLLSYKITCILLLGIFSFVVINTSFASHFSWLLSTLGKSSDFNGRVHLWQVAFEQLTQYKWLGYGVSSKTISDMFTAGGLSWKAAHMHNLILEYLIKGGVIGFLLFCSMWLIKIKKLEKIKNNIISTSIYVMLLISFLMYMFDYRIVDISFWIYLFLLSEIDSLQKNYEYYKMRKRSFILN